MIIDIDDTNKIIVRGEPLKGNRCDLNNNASAIEELENILRTEDDQFTTEFLGDVFDKLKEKRRGL